MGTQTLQTRQTRINYRAAITRIARGQIGEHEHADNRNKYGLWYGMDGFPWCAMFVDWVFAMAAIEVKCENPLSGIVTKKGFSHVTTTFAKIQKRWPMWIVADGEPLLPGDLIFWDHDTNPGGPGHTGVIVEVYADGSYSTVEGNTDPNYGRTGGNVMEHHHSRHDGKHGFILGIVRVTRRYGQS